MKVIIVVSFILLSHPLMAGGWGIAGGMNINAASNDNPTPNNIQLDPALGFQFGTFYSHRFEKFRLRTLAQFRTMRVKQNEAKFNFQVYSFQFALPILFQQMLSESVGYFIGPDFAFNLNTESKRNKIDTGIDFHPTTTSAMIGLTFRLTRRLYIDIYYNHGLTEVAENITHQSAGFQFITYFERQKRVR